MYSLSLIGIGAGNPQHLTLQAIDAMTACDLILIPLKGAEKDDLAALRREICARVLPRGASCLREFDLPRRDATNADYLSGVNDWHDAIATCWAHEMQAGLPEGGRVGFLVWGDPSLYDSTLRIADRLRKQMTIDVKVIPGITSLQAMTAGHAIPLNTLGAPVTITTGRQLRDHGWPDGVDTLAVMLDGTCAFQTLLGGDFHIWWSAYAGMAQELRLSGALDQIAQDILDSRRQARGRHGWIMDIYVLRKGADLPQLS